MKKPHIDVDSALFSLDDVKQLYMSLRGRVFIWGLGTAALFFLGTASFSAKYKIQASFRESPEQAAGSAESVLKELLGGVSKTHRPQMTSFLKSFRVLRPLVEKTGLQITGEDRGGLFSSLFDRIRDNIKAELKEFLDDVEDFDFSEVAYEEESPLPFTLQFSDEQHFTVTGKETVEGVLGVPVSCGSLRFTLNKVPGWMQKNRLYKFSAISWIEAAVAVRSSIHASHEKFDSSIYTISLCTRDRHRGAKILNELMQQYQLYLKQEYDDLASRQIGYLEERQGQMDQKLEEILDENARYFERNLADKCLLGMDDASKNLALSWNGLYERRSAIDHALARLDEVEAERQTCASLSEMTAFFGNEFGEIARSLRQFQKQKDLFEVSLSFSEPAVFLGGVEARREKLREVRAQKQAIDQLMSQIQCGEVAALEIGGLGDGTTENEEVAAVLDNQMRLLQLREKMLLDASLYEQRKASELEGIDLSTARELFVRYNGNLDAAQKAMRHYEQFKNELENPDFSLASLSAVLTDPTSHKLIAQAAALDVQRKDEKNCSSKESDRWQEEISFYRKLLAGHLEQLYKVEVLNCQLLKEKISDLQKISLDCIHREIAMLEDRLHSSIKEHRKNLLQERVLVEEKMEQTRARAADLPEKWRFEKWLALRTTLVSKIMESMTQAVESKTIASHLHHVASKPLDLAIAPPFAEKPYLILKSLVGSFVFCLIMFVFSFFRRLFQGFPLSYDKLKAIDLPVLGKISNPPDLEVLRRMALFSRKAQVTALLMGSELDYSERLGEILGRASQKALLISCDFCKEAAFGLLQACQGEALNIQKRNGYDWLSSGGKTQFGSELIQSKEFLDVLQTLKSSYEQIFLLFSSPLTSAETLSALKTCDQAIATIHQERIEELTELIDWAYDRESPRITFVSKT